MKKFSKIFGIAAAVSMLASLMIVAAPASAADPLQWNAAGGMPSSNSDTNNELRTGSDVSDIAVAADNSVIWVVDSEGNRAFVSADGGKKWTLKSAATIKVTTPTSVAIAPDDPDIVVIAGGTEVAVSTNGGTSFSTLSSGLFSLTTINDVAISPLSSGVHYVAVAGAVGGAAGLQYFNLGSSIPSWTDAAVTGSSWNATTLDGGVAINAVAFSPAFASDQIITVVSSNVSTFFEIASFSTKKWNEALGFTDYNGIANVLDAAGATGLNGADISLYPTYLGADDQERKAFVTVSGTNGGLYRLNDATPTAISGTTITTANSVAYDGTNLVVGSDTNVVWSSSNPTATSPTITSTNVYQRPGGQTMTSVAWLGSTVIAGTVGNESAFAVSNDNGVTFNDISLIDTALTNITDFQKTADGGTIFMVTYSGTDYSIWKKVSRWERIFSQINPAATPDIIRLSPDNANNIYIADLGGQQLLYSSDGGETKWSIRSLPATPVDIAVESNEVAYALSSTGNVYKTTNAGFIWGSPKATGIDGATIVSLGTDLVLVGGASGGVAWSTDGNASTTTWTNKTAISGGGAVQVAASGLADGDFIYAGDNGAPGNIVRWKLGTSTSWDDIISGSANVTGLVLSDGVLYAISVDTVGLTTDVLRTLSPTSAKSTTTWDSVRDAGKVANVPPRSLIVTAGTGSQNLWVINTNGTQGIRTFEDTLYAAGPTQNSPVDGGTIQVNPVSGGAYQVVLSWDRISLATSYTLQVAYDSAFTQLVTPAMTVGTGAPTVVATLSAANVQLDPGITYYWRVKATAPIASPYSVTRTFILEELAAPPPPFVISSPTSGASNVSVMPLLTWVQYPGAIRYEVALSEDPSFAIVEWVRNVDNNFYSVEEALKYSTTYYWRVRGVTGERVGTGPVPAGPWATGVFQTMDEPAGPTTTPTQPTATVIVTQPGTTTVVEVPTTTPAPIPAYLLWLVIIIGAILIIALIVLIVRTRRVA